MNAGHIIQDLEIQLRNQFAELADTKEKLLDTQVQLERAEAHIRAQAEIQYNLRRELDEAAEPDQLIEVHHYHHVAEDE